MYRGEEYRVKKWRIRAGLAILGVLVIIQLIPVNRTNPPVVAIGHPFGLTHTVTRSNSRLTQEGDLRDNEHRAGCNAHDPLGSTPKQKLFKMGWTTVHSHHHQIDVEVARKLHNLHKWDALHNERFELDMLLFNAGDELGIPFVGLLAKPGE
jgi:hypothetical protein